MKGGFRSLNEILSFRGGGTPRKDVPEYWSDEIPWASVKDFKSLDLAKTQDSISRKGLEASASNLIPAGHVIIPTRMALGKAAINSIDMAINQDLRALIPKVPLDSRYLLHSMIGLADEIIRYGSGATVKGITQENLGKLQIPLPPLAEQKRIAAILDAADALRAKRRETLAQLDALLQSTFLTLFGGPVTNPMGWPVRNLTSVIGDSFRNGLSPSTRGKVAGRVLTLSAITSGEFAPQFLKDAIFDRSPSENQQVTRNTFLICRGNGNKSMVGIGVFPLADMPSVSFPDTMIACTIDRSQVEPEYLQSTWSTAKVRKQIDAGARTTNGTYKVNQALLGSIEFPLPPLDVQQKFAAIVESIERQKTAQRGHLAELEALFAALQHRAFRGEL
ncbi:MAG: restriction endonuclease subunit S [Verrucomicrobiota bacterium]